MLAKQSYQWQRLHPHHNPRMHEWKYAVAMLVGKAHRNTSNSSSPASSLRHQGVRAEDRYDRHATAFIKDIMRDKKPQKPQREMLVSRHTQSNGDWDGTADGDREQRGSEINGARSEAERQTSTPGETDRLSEN